MRLNFNLLFLLIFYCISSDSSFAIESKRLGMSHGNRGRNVPVVMYQGRSINKSVVMISHGYGIKNTEYSFLANALAASGYFVVSIQHDLMSDGPRPKKRSLWQRREPFWKRGVQNILFVLAELRKFEPKLDLDRVILIGHSDGGGTSMMLATHHPEIGLKDYFP